MPQPITIDHIPDIYSDFKNPVERSMTGLYICELEGKKGHVYKLISNNATSLLLRSLIDDSVEGVSVNAIGRDYKAAFIDGELCMGVIPKAE